MLKSYRVVGWGGGGGGPCDYCVSPSPFGLDFGTLDFGTSDLGLTIFTVYTLSFSQIGVAFNINNKIAESSRLFSLSCKACGYCLSPNL